MKKDYRLIFVLNAMLAYEGDKSMGKYVSGWLQPLTGLAY